MEIKLFYKFNYIVEFLLQYLYKKLLCLKSNVSKSWEKKLLVNIL